MEKQFYRWNQFEKDCAKLASLIKKNRKSFNGIYGIPRGGLILAVRLSHKLGVPLITDKSLITRETLIADDIADSGQTLASFLKKNKLNVATLFYNPESVYKPTYFCRKKTAWVVFPWEEEKTSRYDKTII